MCIGTEMILGNKLDPSLLVGLLAYINIDAYETILGDWDDNIEDGKIKLGLYLYDQNYYYFNRLI